MQKAWNEMDRNYSVTRFETELSIDELLSKYFDFEKTHKLCSACSGYAQTWACPPFDFEPEDFFRQYSVFRLIVDRIDNAGAADVDEAQQRLFTEKDRYDQDPNLQSYVTIEDLRAFGMVPEFIGRLPIIVSLESLTRDMMVRILTEPKNAILKQYQKLLALDEVRLEFDQEAVEAIADRAIEKKTGARALRSIIEEFMLDIMYEIPKDDNIGTVTITRDYIEKKGGPRIAMRGMPALTD